MNQPPEKKRPVFQMRCTQRFLDVLHAVALHYEQADAEYVRQAVEKQMVEDGFLTQEEVDSRRGEPYSEYQRRKAT